jgi:hypothetical protein
MWVAPNIRLAVAIIAAPGTIYHDLSLRFRGRSVE